MGNIFRQLSGSGFGGKLSMDAKMGSGGLKNWRLIYYWNVTQKASLSYREKVVTFWWKNLVAGDCTGDPSEVPGWGWGRPHVLLLCEVALGCSCQERLGLG